MVLYWTIIQISNMYPPKKTIAELKQIFPSIQDSNILGHSDISPNRKSDPGPNFEWEKNKIKCRLYF